MGKVKERVRERFGLLISEAKSTAIRLSVGDASVLTKSDRIAIAITIALTIIGLFTASCFAASGDYAIIDKAGNVVGQLYAKFVGITTGIAGLCIIIGVLWTMLSPTSKGAATPLAWIKKVVVCYVAILCIGGFFALIKNITDGQSTIDGMPG